MAKFEIFQSEKSGKFYWRLKAKNGQVILGSEAYEKLAGAENGCQSAILNGRKEERFVRKETRNGDPYFILKAANNQPIGKSEAYSSKAGREKGIQSVKNNVSSSELKIVNLTNYKLSEKTTHDKEEETFPIESMRFDIMDFSKNKETEKIPWGSDVQAPTFITTSTATKENTEVEYETEYSSEEVLDIVKSNRLLLLIQLFVLLFILITLIYAN